jgi:hypothetical protein
MPGTQLSMISMPTVGMNRWWRGSIFLCVHEPVWTEQHQFPPSVLRNAGSAVTMHRTVPAHEYPSPFFDPCMGLCFQFVIKPFNPCMRHNFQPNTGAENTGNGNDSGNGRNFQVSTIPLFLIITDFYSSMIFCRTIF